MVTRYDPVSLSSFLSQVDPHNLTVKFMSHFIQILCNKHLMNYQPVLPLVHKLCLHSRWWHFFVSVYFICFCTFVAVPFHLVVDLVSFQKENRLYPCPWFLLFYFILFFCYLFSNCHCFASTVVTPASGCGCVVIIVCINCFFHRMLMVRTSRPTG
jgi:hypothetical protein